MIRTVDWAQRATITCRQLCLTCGGKILVRKAAQVSKRKFCSYKCANGAWKAGVKKQVRVSSSGKTRVCCKCGKRRPIGWFYLKSPTARFPYCKKCWVDHHRALRKKNPDYSLMIRRRVKYGLEPDDVARKVAKQKGRCKVCRTSISVKSPVDHDHKLNVVRGLLCNNCNLMIGLCHDDPKVLRSAAQYLEVDRTSTERRAKSP